MNILPIAWQYHCPKLQSDWASKKRGFENFELKVWKYYLHRIVAAPHSIKRECKCNLRNLNSTDCLLGFFLFFYSAELFLVKSCFINVTLAAIYNGRWRNATRVSHIKTFGQRRTQGNFFSMMTSSNGNIFRVTGPLWGKFTGHSHQSGAELWCFLWSAPVQLNKQSWCWWFETPSISRMTSF